MKYLAIPLALLITACGGSESEDEVDTQLQIASETQAEFKFVNHQTKTLNLESLLQSHAAHMPYYLKLTTQNATSNIYLGEITEMTRLSQISAYLPASEERIYFEIFNRSGFNTTGHFDI